MTQYIRYTEKEARELVSSAGRILMQKKLIARTWGNISARIAPDMFIVTPSGRDYETLGPEDCVKVHGEDLSYEGTVKPSSEKGFHAAVYALRPNAHFIIHTHQFYASALSAAEKDFPFAPCCSYGLPGTKKLCLGVQNAITKYPENGAFLLAKHGALLIGDSCTDAFRLADKLEENAKAAFLAALGNPPENGAVSEATDEPDYLKQYSEAHDELRAYIDDFAQIVGPGVKLAKGSGFLRPFGAYSEDAEAVEMIAQKNAAAALYAETMRKGANPKEENLPYLASPDALLERAVYVFKYSKLKKRNK